MLEDRSRDRLGQRDPAQDVREEPSLGKGPVLSNDEYQAELLGQGLRLGALFKEAGVPDGIVNIISGAGTTGKLLSEHMRIRKV